MQGAELFRLFVKFFGCGTVYIRSDSSRCDFIVQDLDSVLIKVLPHFDLYPLQNIKQKDYLDFKEGLSIIRSGLHLNRDGLAKFKAIKEGMNSFRSTKACPVRHLRAWGGRANGLDLRTLRPIFDTTSSYLS